MSSALERLTELARQAEAKGRAQKLGVETRQAADRLRAAEARIAAADRRVREDKPGHLRDYTQAEADELAFNDSIKKIAMYKSHLDADDLEVSSQIEAARLEIRDKRDRSKLILEEIDRELREARMELQGALMRYHQARRELDRLQPQLASSFSNDDNLARTAESFFPEVQIQAFAREIEDGANHFSALDRREQYAQMMIWIGRLRRFQAGDLSDEDRELSEQIFRRLVSISKQFEPGYIEAFQVNYRCPDWDAYVNTAQEQLRLATESGRRNKEVESHRQEREARVQEQRHQARATAQTALEELKGIIARFNLPDEGLEEFYAALSRVVAGYGTSDPQVLELVRPFRDLLAGGEFRALRRNLERLEQDEAKDQEGEVLREQYRDLLAVTRGRTVLMIGGAVREDSRRSLQHTFEFEDLDWEVSEGTRPALLRSLEDRIKNHGVDIVLILKDFVGHVVPERLRPLCEQHSIPCLMVEKGYGAAQVGEALRRGLLKTV
jgi:hypothetical protein